MKKKRKAGKKGAKWQHSGMNSKKMEEILEQRRIEGDSLQLEVMRKVLWLVVHERMSQGKGVKGNKEKKNESGKMREKPNIAVEVHTEETRKRRNLSQSEMDQCWKNLAEKWRRKF